MRILSAGVATLVLIVLAAPEGLAKEPPPKTGSVLHRSSARHERPYSLYVPSKYSPKSSWPLVLSSHGLNGTGKGEIGQWTGLANEYGFIVACPDMCSATEGRPTKTGKRAWEEDDEVLVSIYEEVCGLFRVNRLAVMITGFSGGGNPSYYTGLRHPDLITHICTRGGNFASWQIPKEEELRALGRERLDIYIYYGENDHELIRGTPDRPGDAPTAHKCLTEAGYTRVKIEQIPGMGHQSRPKIAAAWFGEYLKANQKRFAAGDQVQTLIDKARAAIEKEKYRDAVRDLLKAKEVEEKADLPTRTKPDLDALSVTAGKMIAEAKELHAGGDAKGALKLVGKVWREFRGLPAAEEAKELEKEWKQ